MGWMPTRAGSTGAVDWARNAVVRIAVLGGACIALQQVSVPYVLTFHERIAPGASLVHLQIGLLLAIGMIVRERVVLAGCVLMSFAGWLIRSFELDYTWLDRSSGISVAVGTYLWVRLCARWMGWPRPSGGNRLTASELPLQYLIALIVFPAGITALSAISMPWLSLDQQTIIALQMFFAKHFGVAVLAFPIVATVSEWRSPSYRQIEGVWPWLILVLLLCVASIMTAGVRPWLIESHAGGVALMDGRLGLFAALGWAVLYLRPRYSMPLLSLTLFLLVRDLASAASLTGHAMGFLNLLHLAIELAILSIVLMYLLLTSRDGVEFSLRLAEESRRDPVTRLPNINAMFHRLATAPPRRAEIGYLMLSESDAMAEGFGLEVQAAVMN